MLPWPLYFILETINMLNPNYIYCFLDFETTWLSHEKDDAIQIGLVITNSQLDILESFSSYINPGYEVDQLKTIVSYTTWITVEQIQSGISLNELREVIIKLIPEHTVFVWHNIQFDLKFLNKYMKGTNFGVSHTEVKFIDTLDWAKALIHYPPSFSLDILYPLVREQMGSDYFLSLADKVWLWDILNHDALSDCLICVGLISYSLQKIRWIIQSFPITSRILAKSDMWFLNPSLREEAKLSPTIGKVPLLDFPEKLPSSMIQDTSTDWSNFPNGTKLYYGNLPIQQLVRKANSLGKYIIATNSKQKLSILKSKCKSMGLHNISFVREQQQVNKDKLNRVYGKFSLSIWEWRFFLKYCSHKLQWLWLLDLNSAGDYKVYNYIRQDEQTTKSNIIVSTHSALFSLLEHNEYSDYTCLFLDHERWYSSYLKYVITPRDPINFARVVENFIYQYTNDGEVAVVDNILHNLMNLIDTFCGVLSIEVGELLQGLKPDGQGKYEIGVIADNKLFPKTNILYERVCKFFSQETIHDGIINKDYTVLYKQFEKLQYYMEHIVAVTPTVSDYTTYSFSTWNNYVEYSEFLELFEDYRYYFLSNRNTTLTHIDPQIPWGETTTHTVWLQELDNTAGLTNAIQKEKVFILNNSTIVAKKIFEKLMEQVSGNVDFDYKVLVENVTGWRGKNIALSKSHSKWVLVGWYEMFLQCIQEKITPDQVIIYQHLWLLHEQIVADLQYWMK